MLFVQKHFYYKSFHQNKCDDKWSRSLNVDVDLDILCTCKALHEALTTTCQKPCKKNSQKIKRKDTFFFFFLNLCMSNKVTVVCMLF